jgi:hypothetical protein
LTTNIGVTWGGGQGGQVPPNIFSS